MEILKEFRSLNEWIKYTSISNEIFSSSMQLEILENISNNGLIEPYTQISYSPKDIVIKGNNYRETIRAGRLISRQRALLKVCENLTLKRGSPVLNRKTRIYSPEALTDFALFLRASYPYFVGSEYAETAEEISNLFPIGHQNLLDLSYPSDIFDVIFSNDVFEHVPDIDQALCEIFRVLSKQGGVLISTFPFLYGKKSGVVKARIINEVIELLTEPEYHGNPMRPSQGSLVFELPGWDIVDRAKKAGFSDAYFAFITSTKNGILGMGINGVFVFVAVK